MCSVERIMPWPLSYVDGSCGKSARFFERAIMYEDYTIDEQHFDQQQMHEERERMSEAALIECARMGLVEDHLRQLCMECGISYDLIKR
jgi:hypothetical protein